MEPGHYSLIQYTNYELQLLLDEAVELEHYEYAAAIKREQDRRKEQPWEPPKLTGGIKDAFIIRAEDLQSLGDTTVGSASFSNDPEPKDHTVHFEPNPYSVLPFGEQISRWEEYLQTPMEFGFTGVPRELFGRIYDYLQKSNNLSLKSFQHNISGHGDSLLTIYVRRSNAGIEEFNLFSRIFFPET